MRARLKSLRSDDVPDLAAFAPEPPDDFAVALVLEIGALGQRGRERFDLLVVTPQWLLSRHGRRGAVLGSGKLIVFEWSYERIRRFLAKKVEACTGATWPEVARKVARIAEWEGDEENVVGLL
jgi:hypothetical protein